MLDFNKHKRDVLTALENRGIQFSDSTRNILLSAKVEWSNKMTSAAGKAYTSSNRIVLSRKIYSTISLDEKIQTFKHEFIHLAVERYYNRRIAHGNEWKRFMVYAGLKPEIYHEYKVEHRSITKRYGLECVVHGIVHKMTKRMYDNNKVYTHKNCGHVLRKVILD